MQSTSFLHGKRQRTYSNEEELFRKELEEEAKKYASGKFRLPKRQTRQAINRKLKSRLPDHIRPEHLSGDGYYSLVKVNDFLGSPGEQSHQTALATNKSPLLYKTLNTLPSEKQAYPSTQSASTTAPPAPLAGLRYSFRFAQQHQCKDSTIDAYQNDDPNFYLSGQQYPFEATENEHHPLTVDLGPLGIPVLENPIPALPDHFDPSTIPNFEETSSTNFPIPYHSSNVLENKENNKKQSDKKKPTFTQEEIQHILQKVYPTFCSSFSPPRSPSGSIQCLQCQEQHCKLYSCRNCFDENLYCSSCILKSHTRSYFHRIWYYDKSSHKFSPSSLKLLGMKIHLSHSDGSLCKSPSGQIDMTIYALNGSHDICFHCCNCDESAQQRSFSSERLLANRLFPATWTGAKTAFTLELLEGYNLLNLKGCLNIKQQCDVLTAFTPSSHPSSTIEATTSGTLRRNFHKCSRIHRLISSMLRVGAKDLEHFHKIGLAPKCPICPHPGINLPDDWRIRKHALLLSTIFLMGDGNFHLQLRKLSASLKEDPSLYNDSGFWAKVSVHSNYLLNAKHHVSSNPCGTRAGNSSRDRPSERFQVNGVFAAQCKHGLFISNGVCDLQKGEKFSEVDIVFLQVLQQAFSNQVPRAVVTYDISCSYHKNLKRRATDNPACPLESRFLNKLQSEKECPFRVNSFHQYSHKGDCAKKYGIVNTAAVGRVSGEEVETSWSCLNKLQTSTREMDAGARRDCISSHIEWHSIQKIQNMPVTLKLKFEKAFEAVTKGEDELKLLRTSLNEISPGCIDDFVNEYKSQIGGIHRPNMLKLANLPTFESKLDEVLSNQERVFELEMYLGNRIPTAELAVVGIRLEMSNEIDEEHESSVSEFNDCVHLQFPSIVKHHNTSTSQLALPSSLNMQKYSNPDLKLFAEHELDLRVGYGHDLLAKLRSYISIGTINYRFSQKNTISTKEKEKERGRNKLNTAKIHKVFKEYNFNWGKIQSIIKKLNLDSHVQAAKLENLSRLDKNDIQFFSAWVDSDGELKPDVSTDNIPWIWQLQGREKDLPALTQIQHWEMNSLKRKWFHARISLDRWKEELWLLCEERDRLKNWYRHQVTELERSISLMKAPEELCNREDQGYYYLQVARLQDLLEHQRLADLNYWVFE